LLFGFVVGHWLDVTVVDYTLLHCWWCYGGDVVVIPFVLVGDGGGD